MGDIPQSTNITADTPRHLTAIDFDITGIEDSLKEVERLLAETIARIKKNTNIKVDFTVGDTGNVGNASDATATETKAVAVDKLNDAIKGAIISEEKWYAQNKEGETLLLQTAKTAKIVGEDFKTTTARLTENVTGQKQLKIKTDDGTAALKKQQTELKKTEDTLTNQKIKLDDLAQKYELLIKTIKEYNATPANTAALQQAENTLSDISKLQQQNASGVLYGNEAKDQLATYNRQVTAVKSSLDGAKKSGQNFLSTISDKARWLSAFYLVQMVLDGFRETYDVVVETEDAIIDLQRVLNNTNVSDTIATDKIYELAVEYGRTFDEVSETVVKFAQAGYEWNEILSLTESTMLAVNTAELAVTDATTGLIAVTSQFNLEATEMELTIDKINKTADNFPVTSKKIVDALVRMGSAANAANLDIDQSIALITALSEATGRTGATMGTALNSLLVFLSRNSSLDVFSGLDTGVADTVAAYRDGAADITDVLVALSTAIEKGGSTMSDTVATMLSGDEAYSTFADTIESESAEFTDYVKEVYGTVGAYRQNYLIALLDNMGTYTDALEGMQTAASYSANENEKAMEAYSKQLQSFITNAKLLAVEFGEAGFLDILKGIVAFGDWAVDATRAVGGLNTVLFVLATVMAQVRHNSLETFWGSLKKPIVSATKSVWAYVTSLKTMTLQEKAARIEASLLNAVLAISPITVFVAAISGGFWAFSKFNEKVRESTDEIKELVGELSTFDTGITSVIDTLENFKKTSGLENTKENLEEIQQIVQSLKDEGILDVGIQVSGTVETQFEMLSTEMLEKAKTDAIAAYQQAQDEFNKLYMDNLLDLGGGEAASLIKMYGLELDDTTVDSVIRAINLDETYSSLLKKQKEMLANNQASSDEYKTITEQIANWDALYASIYNTTEQMATVNFFEMQSNGIDIASLSLDEFINKARIIAGDDNDLLVAMTAIYNKFIASSDVVDTATTSMSDWAGSATQVTFELGRVAQNIDTLSDSVDGVEDSFATINSLIDAYNETGTWSIEMMQQLGTLSGEYVALLNIEGGQLGYNTSATNSLMQEKQKLAEQLLIQNTASQILTVTAKYQQKSEEDLGTASSDTASDIDVLSTSIGNFTSAALTGAVGAQELWAGIKDEASNSISSQYLDDWERDVNSILSMAQGVYNNLGTMFSDPYEVGGYDYSDMIDKQTDAIDAQIDAVNDRYDAEIDKLEKLKDALQDANDARDYNEDLASLQARSGVDYRKDEYELTKEYNDKLAQDAIDNKIAELEAARDAELAILEMEKTRLEATTTIANHAWGNVATNADTSFKETFTLPLENDLDVVTTDLSNQFANSALTAYQAYYSNFVKPLSGALGQLGLFGVGSGNLNVGSTQFAGKSNNTTINNYIAANSNSNATSVARSISKLFGVYSG